MKLSKLALIAAIACGTYTGNVFADQTNDIQLVSCDCDEPVCGCEAVCDTDDCCDSGCDSACDACGPSCGLGLGSCLSCLDCDCCLGDPYSLFGECCGVSAGGWVQLGYTSRALPAFNTYQDNLQLQQAWLYAEKAVDGSCGLDIGGRIDYIYGTDGPNTQAFGTDPRGWDNSWDNGSQYGSALPQLYGEVAYGDLSIKAGHFYTIIGYEVVQATGNFFYSHAYTFNFSEPFTHTGALATYTPSDDITVWGGYSLGWDSGFDDNGDAWLGGASLGLTDRLSVTYASVAGRFAEPWANGSTERGYMQSVVADYQINDCLNYVFQTDFLDTEDVAGNEVRNSYGINQYLIHSINDCLGVGTRFEWWAARGPGFGFPADAGRQNIYAWTLGMNYRPHANLVFRPEVRFDWMDDEVSLLQNGDRDQTTFGVDAILTF